MGNWWSSSRSRSQGCNVLFVGLSRSGKTHHLYKLMLLAQGGPAGLHLEPTPTSVSAEDLQTESQSRMRQMGFNSESIKGLGLEVWDISGGDPWLWRSFYRFGSLAFDAVVYFISAPDFKEREERQRGRTGENVLLEDRMHLDALLAEPQLLDAQFAIYFNFKPKEDNKTETAKTDKQIASELELLHRMKFLMGIYGP
eukprot:g60862.t1